MKQAVIVDAARTPFGRRNGVLAGYHPVELLGLTQRGILDRNDFDPALIEQAIGGCVTQAGEQASNVTRTAWLHAGLPSATGCTTIDCQCGSSQQATHLIAALIATGSIRAGLSCGVEVMSRVPLMSNMPGPTGKPKPASWTIDLPNQFVGADRIAANRSITRSDLDAFGLRSQTLAARAWDSGRMDHQIIAVPSRTESGGMITRDEGLRASTAAGLAGLKPALEGGLHTPGTISQISDGASAVLMMEAELAAELGLRPRARIISQALVGGDPYYQLDSPVQATERILARSGMSIADIDVFEINEAFAAVCLSWQRVHDVDLDKVNVNGGAIAVGHPVGASGTRLIGAAIEEMERSDRHTALVTICSGGAMATATILERM